MQRVQPSEPESDYGHHPVCPTCGVPMWLVNAADDPKTRQQMFECKVCDGKALLPRLR